MAERTQFTIKSLSQEVIDLTRIAARRKGIKLGAWIEAALRAALVPEEEKLNGLLAQAAKVQKKTFDALVKEGFNESQAIAIIIGSAANALPK